MKKLVIVFGFIFLFTLISGNLYAEDKPVYSITVTGKAKISATPDEVHIFCTIKTSSRRIGQAVKIQAEEVGQFLDFLKKENIPQKDIATLYYRYQPVHEYDARQKKQILKGYEVSQGFRVRAPVKRGGALIDGISNNAFIDRISFVVSNADELREKAVVTAIKNAHDKAEKRAALLNLKLVRVIAFRENSSEPTPRADTRYMAGAMTDSTPQIPAGERDLYVNVSVTYEITSTLDD